MLCLLLSEANGQTDSTHVPEADSTGMSPAQQSLPISLPDAILLDEAVILPYKTYAEFKQAFLSHDSQTEGVQQAQKNAGIVLQQIRMGVTPEMNAYENFRNQVTYNLIRPQGFVIISSNPNQGIVTLIRKVRGK
jgi:hypothetical protein